MTTAACLRGVHHPLVRDGLFIAAILYLLWVVQFVVAAGSHVDAAAYRLPDPHDPYRNGQAGAQGAFLYAPPVAQALSLSAGIPADLFYGLLAAASLGSLAYLIGVRWAAAVLLVPLPFLWQDLLTGNIHIILAASVVAGFRWPGTWAFVLLTKVTPGIGLIWFAVRRDWSGLGVALGVAATISLFSFAVAPDLWANWFEVLRANAGGASEGLSVPVPLLVRLPLAFALVAWGGLTSRPWTVPAAAFLALPIIWLWDGFAVLAGVAGVLLRPGAVFRTAGNLHREWRV